MKNIKFIYFDVGDVIFGTQPALNEISKMTGKSSVKIGEVFDTYAALGQNDTNKILKDFKHELGLPFKTYEDFRNFYTNYFVIIRETHELMKKLSEKYPLGILSNSEPQILETSIKLGKIPDLRYKAFIVSCYVGCRKPDKKIYLLAQEKAGCLPEEILYTDDKPENLEPAKALGWHTILFNTQNPQASVASIEEFLNEN